MNSCYASANQNKQFYLIFHAVLLKLLFLLGRCENAFFEVGCFLAALPSVAIGKTLLAVILVAAQFY